jgi:hypothetical protein
MLSPLQQSLTKLELTVELQTPAERCNIWVPTDIQTCSGQDTLPEY